MSIYTEHVFEELLNNFDVLLKDTIEIIGPLPGDQVDDLVKNLLKVKTASRKALQMMTTERRKEIERRVNCLARGFHPDCPCQSNTP